MAFETVEFLSFYLAYVNEIILADQKYLKILPGVRHKLY